MVEIDSPEWQDYLTSTAREMAIRLNPTQIDQFARYAVELVRWNRKINLTAITDPAGIAIKHFVDSMAPANEIPNGCGVLDIGSGAGFPAIPLKIINPTLRLVLIDASRKKVNFTRQVIRLLGLEGIEALHLRIEALAEERQYLKSFDTVISRAFSALDLFLAAGAPFVKSEGRLIAMKGKLGDEEMNNLKAFDGRLVDGNRMSGNDLDMSTVSYTLPVTGDSRALVFISFKK